MANDPQLDELIRRSKAGEKDAFDALAGRLRPWLTRVSARYSRDPEAVRDLVQETLLRAFRGIGSYDENRPFSNWIFHILRNLSLNQQRRRKPRSLDSIEGEGRRGIKDSRQAEPAERLIEQEISARLTRTIRVLPSGFRELIVMRHVEGLPVRTIARRLGLSEANARVRLYRAMVLLKEKLGDLL